MRHRKKKTYTLNTWVQKKSLVVRSLVSNFFLHGKIITTPKRAFVVKSQANRLLNKFITLAKKYPDTKEYHREAKRVADKYFFTSSLGKKVVYDIVPKCLQKSDTKNSFVADYKLWERKGDWAESILVKLEI